MSSRNAAAGRVVEGMLVCATALVCLRQTVAISMHEVVVGTMHHLTQKGADSMAEDDVVLSAHTHCLAGTDHYRAAVPDERDTSMNKTDAEDFGMGVEAVRVQQMVHCSLPEANMGKGKDTIVRVVDYR